MKRIIIKAVIVAMLAIPALFFLVAHYTGENYYDLPRYIPKDVKQRTVDGEMVYDTVYHRIEPFTLLNEDSAVFSSESFTDKISVVSFIFTNCPYECKAITANLIKLNSIFDNDDEVKVYSITVDPLNDSPSVLFKYKEGYEIESDNWKFLSHPDKRYLYNIIQKQFFVSAREDEELGFIHTDKVVLLDKERVIRGFYDGTDSQSIDDMIAGIQILKENYGKQK